MHSGGTTKYCGAGAAPGALALISGRRSPVHKTSGLQDFLNPPQNTKAGKPRWPLSRETEDRCLTPTIQENARNAYAPQQGVHAPKFTPHAQSLGSLRVEQQARDKDDKDCQELKETHPNERVGE